MEGEQVQQSIPTEQSVTEEIKEQPKPQKSSRQLTIFLVIITILSLCLSGYLVYQNNILKEQLATSQSVEKSTTHTPTPMIDSSVNTEELLVLTCESTQEDFDESNISHDFDVAISRSTVDGKCKITNSSINYTLLFNEGWTVEVSGALSSAAIRFKNLNEDSDTQRMNTLILTQLGTAKDSPFDINDPESIIISGHGEAMYLGNQFADVLSKEIINIGNKKVLEITTTYKSTPNTGKTTDYERKYVILNNEDKTIYEFIINSYDENFDNPESIEMIKEVKEIISSFEFIN